jgi:hypothetical protein
MKKFSVILFALLFGTLPLLANSALITSDEWHNTNDEFGGLKASRWIDNLYLAVADNNVYSPQNEYEMLDGYRWANSSDFLGKEPTGAEYRAAGGAYHYYGQGGWEGYSFEGKTRYYFLFSDSFGSGITIHSGMADNQVRYNTTLNDPLQSFAGFVLVKEASTATAVSEPTGVVLVVIGLMGLAFSRRKKKC